MSWTLDRDELIRRANARAKELEDTSAGTLFKKAGLPEDLLAKRKHNMPSMTTLMRAASALQWDVPRLLGFEGERPLDERRLATAVKLVDQTFGLNTVSPEDCSAMLVAIYKWLTVFEQTHPDLSVDGSALGAFALLLRERFGKNESSIS